MRKFGRGKFGEEKLCEFGKSSLNLQAKTIQISAFN